MEFVYIIRFGEIWIKGKNRRFFEQALEQNIRRTLKRGGCNAVLESERGRLYAVESGEAPGETLELLSRIPGIVSVSVGVKCERSVKSLAENGLALMQKMGVVPVSFKVECKRADKTFPIPSPQLSREVGEYLLTHGLDVPVDVHHPQMVFGVEIQQNGAYAFCKTLRGAGGLPVGVSEKWQCFFPVELIRRLPDTCCRNGERQWNPYISMDSRLLQIWSRTRWPALRKGSLFIRSV